MGTRSHSKSSTKVTLNEDPQERGLRILGRLIAQRLMKRSGYYDDNKETCNQKKDDEQTSGNLL